VSRRTDEFRVGDYWLTKRRDGKSPDTWQIAFYSEKSRSVVYRSTKCRTVELEAAQASLRSYEAAQRSKSKDQDAQHADLVPHLFNYLREHGPDVKRLDTIKSSFRAWIGFLMQDELRTDAKVADVTKSMVARFRRWRMGAHEYAVEWNGKLYRNTSQGVSGEAVQRNIEDLRAALHHAEAERRIVAPKIASVDRNLRTIPKDRVLTPQEMGAMLGYAAEDIGGYRYVSLMIATSARPGVALAFDPATQWLDDIIDLQPEGVGRTNKRNASVPVIAPLVPILTAWRDDPHATVKSRKRWWNTMTRALGLDGVDAYAIRHTVLTYLDDQGVPGAQISGIGGHVPKGRGVSRTTSRNYFHYNPHQAPQAKRALTKLFQSVEREAAKWRADHLRTTPVRGKPIMVVKAGEKA
jgi:integrase